MLLLMPWKSEFHAHYFWYSSVWFSKWDCKLTKKKDCWRKISFRFESLHSLSPWQHTPHQDRIAIKKPRNFNITILSAALAMTMQRRKLPTPLRGSKTNNWYVSIHTSSDVLRNSREIAFIAAEMTQYITTASDAPKRCNSLALVGSSP